MTQSPKAMRLASNGDGFQRVDFSGVLGENQATYSEGNTTRVSKVAVNKPPITTMAKGIGGGFPVAAIGGTKEVMSIIAEGRYSHSGTYNANVIQCAAVSATMDLLAEPGLYERQRALGFQRGTKAPTGAQARSG